SISAESPQRRAPRQLEPEYGQPLLPRMRIQRLAIRRCRRPRHPGLSETVAGKMSATDFSCCQTLRDHGNPGFRVSLFDFRISSFRLVKGHQQPIRPGLFKRRLGLEALEGRHLLRGKVLVVTLTVDLRKRVVRPRVPGLDARSDLEFAQRALFVSQLPQGLAQSE